MRQIGASILLCMMIISPIFTQFPSDDEKSFFVICLNVDKRTYSVITSNELDLNHSTLSESIFFQ